MRLTRLQLRNYGCFADLDLELAAEPGRITLITAPNGAGKSVLRQAFHDLLFDIPVRSPMQFRHGYAGMALLAEAVGPDGVHFRFGWERGGKPQRVTTDEIRFAALRAGVNPQQLESVFALDTTRLRQGGVDLKGGATLSEAMLAGTGELASAKVVRALLEARRNESWTRTGRKLPLNAAAIRLDETRRRLRAAIVRPESRAQEEVGLAKLDRDLELARAEREEATAELRRLNRIALTRPHLSALDEAEAWLAANIDAPALPPDLDKALAAAREQAARESARHTETEQALARAVGDAERAKPDPTLSGLAEKLKDLPGSLGEAEKAERDLVSRRAELAAELQNVRTNLRAIGSRHPEHDAAEAIPDVGLRAELQAAITEEARLRTALELAREGVAKADAELERAHSAAVVTVPLPVGLAALLAEVRADRNPLVHADETEEAVAAAAAEVRQALASVPCWNGTAAALRDVLLPPEAAFERLDGVRSSAGTDAVTARTSRAECVARHEELSVRLADLRPDDLPDTAAVLAARAERDRGMRLVLARAFGPTISAEEAAEFARGEPLPLAYERRVREADQLADRRAAELDRVGEAERLGREINALAEPLRKADLRDAETSKASAEAEVAWAGAVAPLGLGPLATIGEVRQVCTARRAVVEALSRAEAAVAAQERLGRRHDNWTKRLAACLDADMAPLGLLLAEADQRVSAARQAEQTQAQRRAALDGAERAVLEAADTRERAEAAMRKWESEWAALLARLGRPPSESPTALTAVLGRISLLETHHGNATSLARRIHDMETDLDRFKETVFALARDAGCEVKASAVETARSLIERMTAASAAAAASAQAGIALRDAAAAEERTRGVEREATMQLDAVIAACGATDADGAEARIALSRAHADRVAQRDAARAKLIEHGEGLETGVLRQEAAAVLVAEMVPRREAAESAASSAQARAEDASVALNTARTASDLRAASTEAMDAQADHQAAIAAFGRLLEDQLVLRIASEMLGEAVREVEASTGASSLMRTSAAFTAVTGGAYALERHDGSGGEELHAVERTFPNERKTLAVLSEGTRDQLYLALRMEALRDHCRSATAVPFIADDILQTFDDRRAAAAVSALRELSADVQVIVLTHHPHLATIAQAVAPGAVHFVQLCEGADMVAATR